MSVQEDRVPTRNQAKALARLAGGDTLVVGRIREVGPLWRHGWVSAKSVPSPAYREYGWVRITPDGLRALAAHVERNGPITWEANSR